MKLKIPPKKVFWVPVPDTGQNRSELIEYKFNNSVNRKMIDLINLETNQAQTFEILDYLGSYPIYLMPLHIIRDSTDILKITSAEYGAVLQRKVPEFRGIQKAYFYQVFNPNL